MNRIKLGLLAESEHLQVDPWTQHQFHHVSIPNSETPSLAIEHSVVLPADFENRYRYPVVIWLHADGADHHQLTRVMAGISEQNFIGGALRGPSADESGLLADSSGFRWHQSPRAIEETATQIQLLVEHLRRRFRINSDRVFVAGAECGGTMAYRMAFQHPDWFCGVASFNGSLPVNQNPLINLRSCRNVPVFQVQSRDSRHLSEASLCEQLKLLHVAGFDVTMRQYPRFHQCSGQPLADFNCWMMEQLATQPGSSIVL